MRLGYNTNGFTEHDLEEALNVLVESGYEAVAISLDRDLLDPPNGSGVARCIDRIAPLLDATNLSPTIETGGRHILDPHRKHHPTLLSPHEGDRRRRIDFLTAAIDIASGIGADVISLWSGRPEDGASSEFLFQRLRTGLVEVLDHATKYNVRLAFEPEPDMFIETMQDFRRLHEELAHPLFGLTLDVGHVHCLGDGSITHHILDWREALWNLHVEDMCRGRHKHLQFGDGEIQFGPIFRSLEDIQYEGPIHVELSRHSHNAVSASRTAMEFLKRYMRLQKR